MPYTSSFVLTVTSPSNYPQGTPATIGFRVDATAVPAGLTAAQAASFVTIVPLVPGTGTFTAPSQSIAYTVTVSFPYLQPPANASGVAYGYQIYAINWPLADSDISNIGAAINATATLPPSAGQPPVVTISDPTDNKVFTYPAGTTFPVQIPLQFQASAATAFPVKSVDANLDGVSLTVSASSTPSALVTANAMMSIPATGNYTVQARGTNDFGTASTHVAFSVVVDAPVPPPTVTIVTPDDGSIITVAASSLPVAVPFTFKAVATGTTDKAPITSVSAELEAVAQPLNSLVGLNTYQVDAGGTLTIPDAGTYHLTARAVSAGGSAQDVNTFTIRVTAPPPTVVINTPTPNSAYTYRIGDPATIVPFTFTARSNYGGIRTLTAKVDNAPVTFAPAGLGTLTATGTINLSYAAAGAHTLEVTTTDDYGTATAQSNFTVTVLTPNPAIVIANPLNGAVFDLPAGASTMSVPFTFTTTTSNGFVVSSVNATLDGNPQAITSTTGLNTAAATSTGTMLNVGAGSHLLTAYGTSAGITVNTSATFTVRTGGTLPPTVVINTPPVGSVYSRVAGGPALSIPLTFTGTSNQSGAVITQLTATLDGSPLAVTATNLNTKVATGAATMTVSLAGDHTIQVVARDAYGTDTASRTFNVVVVETRSVCGGAFFDVDSDGHEDSGEFGLGGITVKLLSPAGQVIATDVTNPSGGYCFANIAPGAYTVVAVAPAGLKATTVSQRTATVSTDNVVVSDFGFGLNFPAVRGMIAGGFTIGYWKNNLDKALAGKTGGTQVSKPTLERYTGSIGTFGLAPYDDITMKGASSVMGYNGSSPAALLSKQLIASEYNYQNGAYLNGNKSLTFLFIWWGEYVLANSNRYSGSYLIWAKDWFDAYNNSHGGAVLGPL